MAIIQIENSRRIEKASKTTLMSALKLLKAEHAKVIVYLQSKSVSPRQCTSTFGKGLANITQNDDYMSSDNLPYENYEEM